MTNDLKGLMIYLLITILVELGTSYFIFSKLNKKKLLLTITASNLLTNPTSNFILKLSQELFNPEISFFLFFILEITAVIIEAIILHKYMKINKLISILSSILFNFLSFYLGGMLYQLIK